jgi:threonine/homoserine/homoserine lactone efflux protein
MFSTVIVLASVVFITMMSPGPDMILLIKYSRAQKLLPAIACILGICCGLSLHITLSIFGLAAAFTTSEILYVAIRWAGAAYLIYIGVKSLFSRGGIALSTQGVTESSTPLQALREGFLCNVLNPKVTLFILAVFTQVIAPSTPTLDKVAYGLVIILEAFFVWNLFVALIRTPVVLHLLNSCQVTIDRVIGLILIGFGGSLV